MSKKTGLVLIVLVLCGSLLVSGCGSGGSGGTQEPAKQAKKYNWKMSVAVAETSSWTRGARKFAELVKERTNGDITITVYPNEQLSGGNMVKGIEMVQAGSHEVDIHSTMIWSSIEPKMGAVSLPFIFKDADQVDRALNGKAGEMLKAAVEKKGVHFLAWGENGFRQLTTGKKAVEKPADLKGLKIRIPTIQILVSAFRQFGADPVVMNFAELFTALQQGTVDGQENPLGLIDSSKFYEVQKNLTMWNYCYDAIVLSINQKVWEGLDPKTQQILADSAKEAMEWQKKINREEDAEFIKKFKEKGLNVIIPTPENLEAFKKACEPVYAEAEKTLGKEIIDALRGQ